MMLVRLLLIPVALVVAIGADMAWAADGKIRGALLLGLVALLFTVILEEE